MARSGRRLGLIARCTTVVAEMLPRQPIRIPVIRIPAILRPRPELAPQSAGPLVPIPMRLPVQVLQVRPPAIRTQAVTINLPREIPGVLRPTTVAATAMLRIVLFRPPVRRLIAILHPDRAMPPFRPQIRLRLAIRPIDMPETTLSPAIMNRGIPAMSLATPATALPASRLTSLASAATTRPPRAVIRTTARVQRATSAPLPAYRTDQVPPQQSVMRLHQVV